MKPFLGLKPLFLLFFSHSFLFAQSGLPDAGFGSNGLILANQGKNAQGRAYMIARTDNGAFFVGGEAVAGIETPFMIARYFEDGSLDPAFGQAGIALHAALNVHKLAVLPNGKVVLLLDRGFGLARLNSDGSRDSSFATEALSGDPNQETYSRDLAVLPDGKILVCGFLNKAPFDEFCVARFLENGHLDTSFGQNGLAVKTTNSGAYTSAIAVQNDGKILLTGGIGHDKLHIVRLLENGASDPDFGVNGEALCPTAIGSSITGQAIKVMQGGKIWVAADVSNSSSGQIALLRFKTNGQVDSSFATNGFVVRSGMDEVYGLDVQSDGKIIVGGFQSYPVEKASFLRFQANGEPDNGYASPFWSITDEQPMGFILKPDDKVLTAIPAEADFGINHEFFATQLLVSGEEDFDFGLGGSAYADNIKAGDDLAKDVFVQQDGKIVVIGDTYSDYIKDIRVMLLRYMPNGDLDNSFASGGKKIYSINPPDNTHAYAVTVQADGKIVAVLGQEFPNINMKIVRFKSNGSLDSGFGTSGIVTVSGEFFRVADVMMQPDQKIVIAATRLNKNYSLIRLNSDGSFDSSFGSSGEATVAMGSSSEVGICAGMALLPDGKLMVGGMAGWKDAAVARFKSNGQLDAGFSGDGKSRIPLGIESTIYSYAFAVQTDGKILFGGNSSQFILTRLMANGNELDPTFGNNGRATSSVNAACSNLLIQPDKKILAMGYRKTTTAQFMVLTRLKENGTPDSTFNNGQFVDTDFGNAYANMRAMALYPDNRLVLVGGVNSATDIDFGITRLHADYVVATHSPEKPVEMSLASPNPCADVLRINMGDLSESLQEIQVFDLQGKQLNIESWEANKQIMIQTAHWVPGLYALLFKTNGGVYTQKVLKI